MVNTQAEYWLQESWWQLQNENYSLSEDIYAARLDHFYENTHNCDRSATEIDE